MNDNENDPSSNPPIGDGDELELDFSSFKEEKRPSEGVSLDEDSSAYPTMDTFERERQVIEIEETDTPQEKKSYVWEIFSHLSAFSVFMGVPFGNILGPLTIYLIKRNVDPNVVRHASAALRFQLSITAYFIALFLVGWLLGSIAVFIIFCLAAASFVLPVLAAIKASGGGDFEYPLTLRII